MGAIRKPGLLAATVLTVAALAGCGARPAATSLPPAATGATTTATAESAGRSAPSGGPAPTGFAATSVTFVSPQEGFVLGTAPCRHAPCITIARTLDRGATWRSLPAPAVPVGRLGDGPQPEAQGIRFATPMHGFVFGNGLWETADGGGHWAPAAYPGGGIISLAAIDGQVLALISLPSRGSPGSAIGETLFRRPLGGGTWQPVTRIGASALSIDTIATHAGVAAVLSGDSVLVTVNGGLTLVRHALPRRRTSDVDSAVLVAPTGGDALTLVWNTAEFTRSAPPTVDSAVYTSDDLGAHWAKAGALPGNAYPYAIAAATPGDVVIGMLSTAPWLIRSTDGGATWASVTAEEKHVVGWADLAFTTPADGSAIRGPAGSLYPAGRPGQLLLTSDGGATWHQVQVRF